MNLPPVIILVRPQMGENIGSVARAMSNFGLEELRLVAPRDGWPNPRAKKTASGAELLLKTAKLYPDFASATADINLAYATTARPRDMEKRVVTPEEAAREVAQMSKNASLPFGHLTSATQRVAFVFGPERTGLENEELTWCDTLITIPTAGNKSLNLAQSVVILGHEYWKARSAFQIANVKEQMSKEKPLPSDIGHLTSGGPATLADWQGLFSQLESYLDEVNYYRVADKKTIMWQNLKTMLLRARWSDQEIRTFRGMLRALWERRVRNSSEE